MGTLLRSCVKVSEAIQLPFWAVRGVGHVMYRKNVALQCGCSVPTAERLQSSAVGVEVLVAHTADECILCVRGGDVALPKLLWDFLL